jgi:hypothetical protein
MSYFLNRQREYRGNRRIGFEFEHENQTYKLEVNYDLGGMNYFSGRVEARGLYLSISPINIMRNEKGERIGQSYTAFTGIKMLIEPQARYNETKLDVVATRILSNPELDTRVIKIMQAVLAKRS